LLDGGKATRYVVGHKSPTYAIDCCGEFSGVNRIDAIPRSDSVSERRYARRDDNAVLGPSMWDSTPRVYVRGGVEHPVGGGISHPDLRANTSGDVGR